MNQFQKGIQLWSVREQLEEDPKACLEQIAKLGYRHVEGYDLIQLSTLKPLLDELSIEVKSSFILWSHITGRYDLAEKINYQWMPKVRGVEYAIENALELGLDTIVCGYLLPQERESLDSYKQLAHKLNTIGEKCLEKGLRLLYHNHTFEFEPLEGGEVPYFFLIEQTESAYLNFEIDTLWAEIGGHHCKELICKLGTRLKQVHLKTGATNNSPLYNEKDYPPTKHDYPLGTGFVDIEGILDLAIEQGVNRFYVEQEYAQNMYNCLLTSLDFLKSYTS